MTQIFLGYPPEHIKDWIIEHSQANPPTGNETWVPASNLDGSPLTDTEHAKWVFSDGQKHTVTFAHYMDDMYIFNLDGSASRYNHNGEEWIMGMPDMFPKNEQPTETQFTITNPNNEDDYFVINAYRAYIPGHWEDADGNWINGSWDSETRMTKLFDDGVTSNDSCVWVNAGEIGPQGTISKSGWYIGGGYIPSSDIGDKNTSFIYDSLWTISNKTAGWKRTWTNTKPAPENQ